MEYKTWDNLKVGTRIKIIATNTETGEVKETLGTAIKVWDRTSRKAYQSTAMKVENSTQIIRPRFSIVHLA
jgi:hypothetical protein